MKLNIITTTKKRRLEIPKYSLSSKTYTQELSEIPK